MNNGSKGAAKMTAGLDLGDKYSHLCLIETEGGELIEEGRLRTTPEAIRRRFDSEQPMHIAIEVGTHSPWVSRLLLKSVATLSLGRKRQKAQPHLRQQA